MMTLLPGHAMRADCGDTVLDEDGEVYDLSPHEDCCDDCCDDLGAHDEYQDMSYAETRRFDRMTRPGP